jgi:hypothetical protein
MGHYLGNSGAPLELDLNLLLRDAPDPVQNEVAYHKDRLTEEALVALADTDTTLGGEWGASSPRSSLEEHYVHKEQCEDWFFAMGGHTSWMEGTCAYVPDTDGSGMGTLVFDVIWNLIDLYNWDGDKSVDIHGILVSDEVLGRLHATGLAREFPMSGHLPMSFAVRYRGQSEVPDIPAVKLPWDDREGTRTDPDRDRR